MVEIGLNDIAYTLVILNHQTVEKLFSLENCTDCIALYMFYYKTAKWQRTDKIRANDTYVRKCLNWGSKKVSNTKEILKNNGLISIIQRRSDNKIDGWYIQVHYMVSKDVNSLIIETSKNTQKQEHSKATCSYEDINALRITNKCLKNNSIINNIDSTTNMDSTNIVHSTNNTFINNTYPVKKQKKVFIPPSFAEVQMYIEEKGYNVDPKTFYEYFSEGDWVDSKGNKVKNWKQKIITWSKSSNNSRNTNTEPQREVPHYIEITREELRQMAEEDEDEQYQY